MGKTRKCKWFWRCLCLHTKICFLGSIVHFAHLILMLKTRNCSAPNSLLTLEKFCSLFSISLEAGIGSRVGDFLLQCWRITESKRSPRAIHLLPNSWITPSFVVPSFSTFPDRFLIKLQAGKLGEVLARCLKVWQTAGSERWN